MTKLLTIVTTAIATTMIAGASFAFAANDGMDGMDGSGAYDSVQRDPAVNDPMMLDTMSTGSIARPFCSSGYADTRGNCLTNPMNSAPAMNDM